MKRLSVLIIALSVFLAVPVLAADRIITNGIDLWATRGDGSTFSDFAKSPIPAGFFCLDSEPFTGRIAFKGVPIATGQAGALGNADTIVQRLDNAVFNKQGWRPPASRFAPCSSRASLPSRCPAARSRPR